MRFAFFTMLVVASWPAMAVPPPSQALNIAGTMDSLPFTCRASTNYALTYNPSMGSFESTFLCQGAIPIDCLVSTFTYTFQNVVTDCYTKPPTGAFAVVHLPQLATVAKGTIASMLVQVYNSTGKNLSNLTVTASAAPACSRSATSLAAGQVLSYSCQSPALQSDMADTLTVTATLAGGGQVSGSATSVAQVDVPRIAFSVAPPQQNVVTGKSANWQVRVANAGPSALTSWIISDQQPASNCPSSFSTMQSGQSTAYACGIAGITNSFTDQFSASALNGTSPLVVDQNVTVTVVTDEIFKNGFQ